MLILLLKLRINLFNVDLKLFEALVLAFEIGLQFA